jgi:hypothetical protein
VETSNVDTIHVLLTVVAAPGAEIASALAVLFSALRVRTELGPEGYVTSLATLQGSSEPVSPHVEAYRAWREGAGVSRPGHGECLHSFPPSLMRAGVLLPSDALGMHALLVRGTQCRKPLHCLQKAIFHHGGSAPSEAHVAVTGSAGVARRLRDCAQYLGHEGYELV